MTATADDTRIALMAKDISYIQRDMSEIKITLKEITGVYITRAEFEEFKRTDFGNVKKIAFGTISLILTAFALGVVNFFIKK